MTAIIADDEPLAADGVRRLCEASGKVTIVGIAADGATALRLIHAVRPQAVFLDIAMPELTGLEVAASLARMMDPPRVVLVTAQEHFATEAFDLSVVDYVLKPVDPKRLDRAIDRLQGQLSAEQRLAGEQELWVPYLGSVVRLPIEAIVRIETERDYVRIHELGKSYLLRSTLTDLIDRLGDGFVRVHRSVAVPAHRIAEIRHIGGGAWVAIDIAGAVAPVGRRFLEAVRQRLGLS
ncbi:LytR/AlgR family response regulator transcription factor [Sphingopyxis sp.]|jgi:DNA-binding LytR/AlgR family response regulator|uniref:LytR/AlgR family response regulator transcription factor n=1 Tax=Sphingopyxis sp. TaxID=1908224 RepID=UPI003F70E444